MMRTLKQRVLIALTATLIAAIVGALVGYLLGRVITIRLAEGKLMEHATRILVGEEAYSYESRVMLAKVNNSPYTYCSDTEIAWFRNMIYQSEHLKDVGHMHNGKIECSALLGQNDKSSEQLHPDYERWDGSKIYMNPTPLRFDNQPVTTVQVAGAFAVYNPYNIKIFDSPTMHYTIKLFSAPNRLAGHLEGSATDVDTSVPTLDGQYRLHNTLFSVRCSSRFFNCVTTYLSIPEALRADRTQLALYTTLGGMAGAFLGFICSLLYRHNRSMEQQLRRAIALDEVQVVYQPIVNLTTRRIVGAEALARWTSEDGVVVNPEVFIRLAENLEFVGEITRLVVRKSLRDLGEILRSRTDFRLSINVTAMDLSDPEFLPMLDLLVERAEVSTMNMAIEITEGSTANQDSAIETLRHLRERGYSVHIDDFGTGYSSLSYLRDLSVDAIKIDRSFTQAIGTDAVTVGILPQILAIAEALHLEVIVEGVETRQQADYFGNSPLPVLAQGWLFGRPITSDEFQSLLIEDERKARMDAA